jgi:hypothetical protein
MAYSITSSARPSNESGTVMPSALAVLRLIVNLTFANPPWRRVFLIGFGRWKNWWSRLHEILANIAAFIRFGPGGGNS